MAEYLLSICIFFPLAGALVILLIPSAQKNTIRITALIVAAIQFMLVSIVALFLEFKEAYYTWFMVAGSPGNFFTAGYHVLLDGMSFPLFWLTSLIMLVALLASAKINFQIKGYYSLMLIMHTAISGTFAAADFLLFYVFFEFMLIPMYFLIGIWGGKRREYAALKFFIYTLAGSLLILIAMVLIYVSVSAPSESGIMVHTFDLKSLTGLNGLVKGSILDPAAGLTFWGFSAGNWVFILLITGFAIKVPVVPFHTWLPDAHVEAPTPVSVILAALLLKTGTYGMIRYASMILPEAQVTWSATMAVFAVISIIYGAMNALASKDLKRMIAYSSVSHMGFVILGIAAGTAVSVQGAIFQMVSHGLISAMLFIIAGILQDRTGDRTISNYSGLFAGMPWYASLMLIAFFAGMGIPGFASFIGEVLVLLGSFHSAIVPGWIPITATAGILLSAGYFAWTAQRMLFGEFHSKANGSLTDLTFMEKGLLVFLTALTFYLGILPGGLLNLIEDFATTFEVLINSVTTLN